MKFLLVSVVFAIVVAFVATQQQTGYTCYHSLDCSSSYCRNGRCTTWGSNRGERNKTNPCFYTKCAGGPCYLIQNPDNPRGPGIQSCAPRT